MFDDRKAGQVAAFFVDAEGGRMDVIKLVKKEGATEAEEETAEE